MTKYKQMSTKKLQILLETVELPAEEKAEVENIIKARQAVTAEAPAEEVIEPQAPAAGAVVTEAPTDEISKLQAIADSLKDNVNHRCKVVPFNTIEWVEGYISGIVVEKRAKRVLYAVKTDDGRKIVKVYNSPLIQVLDEVVEVQPKQARVKVTKEPMTKWTEEEAVEALKEASQYIGRVIIFTQADGAFGKGEVKEVKGRIIGVTAEKRVHKVMFRIKVTENNAAGEEVTRIAHKFYKAEDADYTLQDIDEEGQKIFEAYTNRRSENRPTGFKKMSVEDKIVSLKAKMAKLEEKMAKLGQDKVDLQARIDELTQSLEAPETPETPEASEESEDLS